MTAVVGLLAGLVAGLLLVRATGRKREQRARRIYAIGLVVAALIYVGFAAVGGASARWLAAETGGLVIYGAAAWAGLRRWPALLAIGWAAHVAWDVLLHLDGAGAAYTPNWYPWVCVSFDLVLAAALLPHARRGAAPAPADGGPEETARIW